MNNYKFLFNPNDCNKVYFEELILLLNSINPDAEKFNRIAKDTILKLNIDCSYNYRDPSQLCKKDEFFFENKKQIILGRFYDTIGCFYDCTDNFFSMAMEPYSLFKNDVFIRYIIDKPYVYINNSSKIDLEHIFPIRIVLSEKFVIPSYAEKLMNNIEEYTFDTLKNEYALSPENLEIIKKLPRDSILKRLITESYPINHIISRELCILYFMKLYFYIVKNDDNSIKPFILVSKYNKTSLQYFYKIIQKPFPQFEYLFKYRKWEKVDKSITDNL